MDATYEDADYGDDDATLDPFLLSGGQVPVRLADALQFADLDPPALHLLTLAGTLFPRDHRFVSFLNSHDARGDLTAHSLTK